MLPPTALHLESQDQVQQLQLGFGPEQAEPHQLQEEGLLMAEGFLMAEKC